MAGTGTKSSSQSSFTDRAENASCGAKHHLFLNISATPATCFKTTKKGSRHFEKNFGNANEQLFPKDSLRVESNLFKNESDTDIMLYNSSINVLMSLCFKQFFFLKTLNQNY